MYGLTVRWDLTAAPAGVAQELRDYVTGTSLARFSGMDGLRFKTWRLVEGSWFEGTYVFTTAAARDGFEQSFRGTAAESPGSQIVGSAPVVIEPYEVVAVAEGGAGFSSGAGPSAAH